MCRDSSVGIATGYGLDGPGSNPGGEMFSAPVQTAPEGPLNLLCNRYRVIAGGKAVRV